MKFITFVLIFVFLTTQVLATGGTDTPSFYYQKGIDVPLAIPCFDNDNRYCDSSYECNITITSPNFSVLVANQPMTRNNSFYNYTLFADFTQDVGRYMVNALCTNLTYSGYSLFYFEVTNNGFFTNDWTFILAVGFIVFLFIISAFIINSEEHPVLQVILFLFAFLNAMLIPSFFLLPNSSVFFYRLFMGFIAFFGLYLIIYGSYWALCKLELIIPKKGFIK